jgi:hypothetical protein
MKQDKRADEGFYASNPLIISMAWQVRQKSFPYIL